MKRVNKVVRPKLTRRSRFPELARRSSLSTLCSSALSLSSCIGSCLFGRLFVKLTPAA